MSEQIRDRNCVYMAGMVLRSVLRHLRPAFPKRPREKSLCAVTFAVEPPQVTVSLTGGSFTTACHSSTRFAARIPSGVFRHIFNDKFGDKDLIRVSFAPGEMAVGNICTCDPSICLLDGATSKQRDVASSASAHRPEPEAVVEGFEDKVGEAYDPFEGPIGLPLLGLYRHLQRHPDPTLVVNARDDLIRGREQIERLLRRAALALKPLGLSRADIEKLLRARVGCA